MKKSAKFVCNSSWSLSKRSIKMRQIGQQMILRKMCIFEEPKRSMKMRQITVDDKNEKTNYLI